MSLKDLFLPKRYDFYGLLRDQARKVHEGMQALQVFINDPTDAKGARVDALELEADEIRAAIVRALNDSFVTPIDREDLFALSKSVDDMLDYAKSTVEEIRLFKLGTNDCLKRMAEGLVNLADALAAAVDLLGAGRAAEAREHVYKAKKTENFIEHRYREGLADIFEMDDHKRIFKLREVYRHVSNAADHGDAAADILNNIIVKIT